MALIEQKAAVSAISDLLMCQLKGERLPASTEVYHAIHNLTPVDAVPVVRCRDCKWSDWYTALDGNVYGACMYTQISGLREMDYCSRGRREGDGA